MTSNRSYLSISNSSPGPASVPTLCAWHGTSSRPDKPTGYGAASSARCRHTAIDERVLYVCFVANAELGCHLALGWPLPSNVLDLNTEFRCIVNGRTVPGGKGLLGAMAYYGLDSISSKQKDAMRDRILQGWPFTAEEREEILRTAAATLTRWCAYFRRCCPRSS